MLLSELAFRAPIEYRNMQNPPYVRARPLGVCGFTVDQNNDGTYDFWRPGADLGRGLETASHTQLDPIEAQAVLYHYLEEINPSQETLVLP